MTLVFTLGLYCGRGHVTEILISQAYFEALIFWNVSRFGQQVAPVRREANAPSVWHP